MKMLWVIAAFIVIGSHTQSYAQDTDLSQDTSASNNESMAKDESHNEWLKTRFSAQHQKLIPIVAVADMYFSCQRKRKSNEKGYTLDELITKMPKNTLAEKLSDCLGEDTMQSDAALNFGLLSCFHGQLAYLPDAERQQKMQLVKQSIKLLSHDERKRSFTQCVTEQSIYYLK